MVTIDQLERQLQALESPVRLWSELDDAARYLMPRG
jgi:hypothetical protein